MNDDEQFAPGDTVICVPVMPGFEELAGREGIVKEKIPDTSLYRVRFGKTKIVRISAKELKKPDNP